MLYKEKIFLVEKLRKRLLSNTTPEVKESIIYKLERLEATPSSNQFPLSSILNKTTLEEQLKIEENIQDECNKFLQTMSNDKEALEMLRFAQSKIHFLRLYQKEKYTGNYDFSKKISGKLILQIKNFIFDPIQDVKLIKLYINRIFFKQVTVFKDQDGEYEPVEVKLDEARHLDVLLISKNNFTILGLLLIPCEFLVKHNGRPVCLEFDTYTLIEFKADYEPGEILWKDGQENLCLVKDGHVLEIIGSGGISYCIICEGMIGIVAGASRCYKCKIKMHHKCIDFILFKCMHSGEGAGLSIGRSYNIQHTFENTSIFGLGYCMQCGDRICSNDPCIYCTGCKFYYHRSCKKYIPNSCQITYSLRMEMMQLKDVRIENMIEQKTNTLEDYEIIDTLGSGSFADVLLAKPKKKGELIAIKAIAKEKFKTPRALGYLQSEIDILMKVTEEDSLFVTKMLCCFQNDYYFFLGIEYESGGNLFEHNINNKFTEEQVRFITVEIIMALEFLHRNNIAFRDLKLGNILLTKKGHIKLCDFGLAKDGMEYDTVAHAYCGTLNTIAPEVFKGCGYRRSVDFWSLGVVLYELMHRKTPFYRKEGSDILESISKHKVEITADVSAEVKDFNLRLLFKDPTQRLGYGANGLYDIKSHCWFKGIDWDLASRHALEPCFVPGERIHKKHGKGKKPLPVCPLRVKDYETYWKNFNY